jgi:hypothetical protein
MWIEFCEGLRGFMAENAFEALICSKVREVRTKWMQEAKGKPVIQAESQTYGFLCMDSITFPEVFLSCSFSLALN